MDEGGIFMSKKGITVNDLLNLKQDHNKEKYSNNKSIAVIGMACNSALGNNKKEMWESISNKLDCIRKLPKKRMEDLKPYVDKNFGNGTEFVNGGYLERIDQFDYRYFKITPIEAKLMSPNQRLFMQSVSEAIYDAGYDGKRIKGSKTGIFGGYVGDLGGEDYKLLTYMDKDFDSKIAIPANLPSMIPSRIAYLLDLKGPTMLVDTACSSSLVAVHLACKSILQGECDMAIAGGVRVNMIPIDRVEAKLGVESSDDITRTFDIQADGTGMGEGTGSVMLKSLDKAIEDNDNIYAVIKGSAINQDGYGIGITAPNKDSQIKVLSSAWKEAGINPESLGYIECHGTATSLGDPIELDAISEAIKKYTNKKAFCAVGAVKTNIGHLYQAAGIMGFIKTILALRNKTIPPNVNFNFPNDKVDFEDSPTYVNTKARYWEKGIKARCAGVSAFGLSGTNCHIVLEEFTDDSNNMSKNDNSYIFTFSAMDEAGLRDLLKSYSSFLKDYDEDIEKISYTLNTGREHHSSRAAVIAGNKEDLLDGIHKILEANNNEDLIYINSFKIVPNEHIDYDKDLISVDDIKKYSEYAERIVGYIKRDNENTELMKKICELYVKGASIEWEKIYFNKSIKKVSLLPYPLKKDSVWVEYEKAISHFYTLKWKQDEDIHLPKESNCDKVILFTSSKLVKINESIKNRYAEVIEVVYGNSFEKVDDSHFNVNSEDDYQRLLECVGSDSVQRIIHVNSFEFNQIKTEEELVESQNRGVYSLLYLVRALSKVHINRNLECFIFTNSSVLVNSQEKILNPHNSTVMGLGKVISKEHPELKCKCIDVCDYDDFVTALDELENNEISMRQLAYRSGKRYVEEFKAFNAPMDKKSIKIKDSGVYIITGAAGGMGREIARELSLKRKIKLILISRRKLQKDEMNGDNNDLINHIERLKSNGSVVEYYDADVTDFYRMSEVIQDVKEKHGQINGVIHSAGVPGKGMIITKEIEDFHKVLWTKVKGTWILDKLTEDQELDLFVLFSSAASVFGEVGQGDYAAANAYLDAYAAYRNMSKRNTVTINWVVWKETGMGIDFGLNEKELLFEPVSTKDALDWFNEILYLNICNVLAGELNKNSKMINELFNQDFVLSNEMLLEIKKEEEGSDVKDCNVEVKLKGNSGDDFLQINREIALICGNLLGYSTLDVHDNFFELGADSIQIKKIHERVDKVYPGVVTVADMFAFTSIDSLSKYISQKMQKEMKNDEKNSPINGILNNFNEGKIDLDEAIKNLKNF